MPQNLEHQKLVDDLLFAFGSRADVRIFPRTVGVFRDLKSERTIRVGIVGESDLFGIVSPHGQALFIEVKTGKGYLSEAQKKFREMVIKFGGIHIIARSVEQAINEFLAIMKSQY